ncbi:MAG: hypothetical protein ACRDO1_08315 [Nocardioidaceae bacterium]
MQHGVGCGFASSSTWLVAVAHVVVAVVVAVVVLAPLTVPALAADRPATTPHRRQPAEQRLRARSAQPN